MLCDSISTSSYLTASDKNHALQILSDALETKDIPSVHYATLGLKILGKTVPKDTEVCELLLEAANSPKVTAETLFYVTNAHKAINCPQALPVLKIVQQLNDILGNDQTNIQDLYYAVGSLAALRQKPQDVAKLVKTLQAILKKNDSLLNLGYLFHIGSHLGTEGSFAFERIEDAIVQADEVDSKYLQYEGGLSITGKCTNYVITEHKIL